MLAWLKVVRLNYELHSVEESADFLPKRAFACGRMVGSDERLVNLLSWFTSRSSEPTILLQAKARFGKKSADPSTFNFLSGDRKETFKMDVSYYDYETS